MTPRHTLALLGLVLAPGGCVIPHFLDWEIEWGEAGLEDRSVIVEASILEGGCRSTNVFWAEETDATDPDWDAPPDLDEGRYGFAARARDADCVWYARGCREVDMPGDDDGKLTVVLEALETTERACPEEECIAGACDCTAAGTCGGEACEGTDCTCAESECHQRCQLGGACTCSGGYCGVRCDAGAMCTCDGGNCVMDCAAGAECTCAGGGCTMLCPLGADCSCSGGSCR